MTLKQRKTLVLKRCTKKFQEDLRAKQMEVHLANESDQRDSQNYKGKYIVKNKEAFSLITWVDAFEEIKNCFKQ